MKKPIKTALIFLATAAFGALILIPFIGSRAEPAYVLVAASNARQCALAVNQHYQEHGGMPAELPINPGLTETKTGKQFDWIYYGPDYRGQNLEEFIIVAAPILHQNNQLSSEYTDGQRIVAYADGHTAYLEKDVFRAAIKRQQERAQAPTPPSAASGP